MNVLSGSAVQDILLGNRTDMSRIFQHVCDGCGATETPFDNVKKFKACPQCVERRLYPHVYCSDECWRSACRYHKKKHKDWKEWNDLVPMHFEPVPELNACDVLTNQAISCGGKQDYAGAIKFLRKAQKLYPHIPEIYTIMASCVESSGHYDKEIYLSEEATRKWCAVCISKYHGDDSIDPMWALKHWSISLTIVVDLHHEQPSVDKPSWITDDDSLNRLTKLALMALECNHDLSEYDMYQKRIAYLNRAHSLSGVFQNGCCHYEWNGTIPEDRSAKELREAIRCYRKWRTMADEDDKFNSIIEFLQKVVDKLEASGDVPSPNVNRLAKGNWVLVEGFPTPTCGNHRLGRVCDWTKRGKYIVQVDGYDAKKLVDAKKVHEIRLENPQEPIILSCLKESVQWNYMRYYLESLTASC